MGAPSRKNFLSTEEQHVDLERQSLEVDIACVGFGPAMGGFLTTLARGLVKEDGSSAVESQAMPGMPLQVICYERADDLGFGVSGVVSRARGITQSFPDLDVSQIPMAARVRQEKVVYLLDPIGASRRSRALRLVDKIVRSLGFALRLKHQAIELTRRSFSTSTMACCFRLGSSISGSAAKYWAPAASRYGRACPSRKP